MDTITREKLLSAGFTSGTEMYGNIEYYYQDVDQNGFIKKAFYLWYLKDKYVLELVWDGYDSEVNIELTSWQELEMLFFAFTRERLPIKK